MYSDIFSNIYDNEIWNGKNNTIPLSGPGSSLENAKECRDVLDKFVNDNKCNKVLDLGCGDLTWMSKSRLFNNNEIEYTGVDVVNSLIKKHSNVYPNRKFVCEDITKYVPEYTSLIIIRDVLFHMKIKDILSVFENIKNKFDYIAITSCKNNNNFDDHNNVHHFCQLNIHKDPFNISHNYIHKTVEPKFDRHFYIYDKNGFN
jgi:trans-aconitate methyltransferase